MNRRRLVAVMAFGLVGCMGDRACKVRETSAPDARNVHAEAPSLVPAMPVASTGPTRGQTPDGPNVTLTSATANMPAPTGQVAVKIRAHVNGAPILDEELREALVLRAGDLLQVPESRRAQVFQELAGKELERLVERELVLQEAMQKIKEIKRPQLEAQLKMEAGKEADRRISEIKKASKVTDDVQFKAFLLQNGLSVEGLRRQTERNFMMQEYVRNIIFPTVQRISMQQVREYFEEHPDEFTRPDRVKWLDLFVDASRFANHEDARRYTETIAQRARAGEDFAALAKQFDHGDSSLRNGEGLGQKRGEIKPPQCEPVLMSLKAGEVGPIVDLGFGFHVVKVVERDVAGLETFDDKLQVKIRDRLKNVIAEREFKRIVEELKRKATVVVYQN